MSGGRSFLYRMLDFLGFPFGGLLVVVGPIGGVFSTALAGVLAGSVIGAAQWLVLRRRPGLDPGWILATALGLGAGDALVAALTGAGTGIGDLLVTGVAAGVVVGLSQRVILGQRVATAVLWPAVVAVAWPLDGP